MLTCRCILSNEAFTPHPHIHKHSPGQAEQGMPSLDNAVFPCDKQGLFVVHRGRHKWSGIAHIQLGTCHKPLPPPPPLPALDECNLEQPTTRRTAEQGGGCVRCLVDLSSLAGRGSPPTPFQPFPIDLTVRVWLLVRGATEGPVCGRCAPLGPPLGALHQNECMAVGSGFKSSGIWGDWAENCMLLSGAGGLIFRRFCTSTGVHTSTAHNGKSTLGVVSCWAFLGWSGSHRCHVPKWKFPRVALLHAPPALHASVEILPNNRGGGGPPAHIPQVVRPLMRDGRGHVAIVCLHILET